MFIFVDESGTFTESKETDSWCVVAAYTVPENQVTHVSRILKRLRNKYGGHETKLGQMKETDYFEVLHKLSALPGLAFAVSCDVSLHTRELVEQHRDTQAEKILTHVDKMRFEAGRKAVETLANDVAKLPYQLYAQLVMQTLLFDDVLRHAPLYYAQRRPHALEYLRWRLDQKDTTPTAYEETFKRLLPSLLQTKSLNNPMIMLSDGADYSYFKRFDYKAGEIPLYLEEEYGIRISDAANIGKMVMEDFELVDSSAVDGVQVADLIASGVRRLLRGQFNDQQAAARLIGKNLAGKIATSPAVKLATLGRQAVVSRPTEDVLKIMKQNTKRLLLS